MTGVGGDNKVGLLGDIFHPAGCVCVWGGGGLVKLPPFL